MQYDASHNDTGCSFTVFYVQFRASKQVIVNISSLKFRRRASTRCLCQSQFPLMYICLLISADGTHPILLPRWLGTSYMYVYSTAVDCTDYWSCDDRQWRVFLIMQGCDTIYAYSSLPSHLFSVIAFNHDNSLNIFILYRSLPEIDTLCRYNSV